MSVGRFTVWVQHHCPRLLEGIQQWLLYLLHGHAFTQPGEGQEEVLTHTAIGGDMMHELFYAVQSSA